MEFCHLVVASWSSSSSCLPSGTADIHTHAHATFTYHGNGVCMYVGWTNTTTCSASCCWCTSSWPSPVRKSPLCCATSSFAVRLGQRAVPSTHYFLCHCCMYVSYISGVCTVCMSVFVTVCMYVCVSVNVMFLW